MLGRIALWLWRGRLVGSLCHRPNMEPRLRWEKGGTWFRTMIPHARAEARELSLSAFDPSGHRPHRRRHESPAVQGFPGAPTRFWLRRTNVWRRATNPRTGAKRLRSGQIDQVRSFERRFARWYWMRSPHRSQCKDGRTTTKQR
jgi:hypothetical protein